MEDTIVSSPKDGGEQISDRLVLGMTSAMRQNNKVASTAIWCSATKCFRRANRPGVLSRADSLPEPCTEPFAFSVEELTAAELLRRKVPSPGSIEGV